MPRFDPKTQLTRELLERLYDREHRSSKEIADRFGCGETTVLRALHEHRIPIRSKRDYRLEIPREDLKQLYIDEGLTEEEIAQQFNCTQRTISRRLIELGIPTRGVGPVAIYTVPSSLLASWTENLAYAIGLIATDGNLSKDSVQVEFISTDRELIDLYCSALGLTGIYISSTSYPLRKTWHKARVSDRTFYAFLKSIGLTPRKSKTLGPLEIPDQWFRDFLRGTLDGDGSWYKSKSWAGRYQYLRVELCSASKNFIAWVSQKTFELAGLQGTLRSRSLGRYHYLTFLGQQALELGNWLYYSPSVVALTRKRDVWEQMKMKTKKRSGK